MPSNPVPRDAFVFGGGYEAVRGRRRWRNVDATRLYEWDEAHGHFEVYNARGAHLGVAAARSPRLVMPAVKGRRIDV